jgi:hypothetical protein
MRQLRFFRMPRASPGVYSAAPGLRWRLVVLSELVRTRGTLILRLLGAGRTFRDALDELQRLPRHDWEAQLAIPWLVRYQFDIRALDPEERTPEEEAIMAAQKFEEWEREVFERGKTLGIDEGRTLGIDEGRTLGIDEGIAAVCERRLRRQLTDDERANVAARRKALGSTRLAEVVLDLSTDELARWIADPDAR